LHSIKRRKDSNYDLRFYKTETKKGKTSNVYPRKAKDVVAEHIILAMPKNALKLIDWEKWEDDPWLRKNLDSVLNQPAMKILLVYSFAWWKALGIVFGRSITDLPIRQTVYFTHPDEANPDVISKKNALLLASYNDIENVPFWKGLAEGNPEDDKSWFKGTEENKYLATKSMITEINAQLGEMHSQQDLQEPIAAAFYDWSIKPYGAGWHCWKADLKFWEVMEKMRHPIENEKVYICGDAYSNDQGWAEGALETAEMLLTGDLEKQDQLTPLLFTPETDSKSARTRRSAKTKRSARPRKWKPDLMKKTRY